MDLASSPARPPARASLLGARRRLGSTTTTKAAGTDLASAEAVEGAPVENKTTVEKKSEAVYRDGPKRHAPADVPFEFKWAFDKSLHVLGFYREASTTIRWAQTIYRTVNFRANHPSLWRTFHVKEANPQSEFQGLQQLVILHIWMVNRRLLREGQRGKRLQYEVFEQMWDDVCRRIRALGLNEWLMTKNERFVQHYSFAALLAYDRVYKLEGEERVHELAREIWRHAFASNPCMKPAEMLEMSKWVISETTRIETQLHWDDLVRGYLGWTFPPSVQVTPEDRKWMVERGMLGHWRSTLAVTGETYWWNVRDLKPQWEKPPAEAFVIEDDVLTGKKPLPEGHPPINVSSRRLAQYTAAFFKGGNTADPSEIPQHEPEEEEEAEVVEEEDPASKSARAP